MPGRPEGYRSGLELNFKKRDYIIDVLYLILLPRLDNLQLPPSFPQVAVDSIPLGQHQGSSQTITSYMIRRVDETIVQVDPDVKTPPVER